jgi:hypothetical protein
MDRRDHHKTVANFRAIGQKPFEAPRKNKQREKDPAPGASLIAADGPESRQTGSKTSQIGEFWG